MALLLAAAVSRMWSAGRFQNRPLPAGIVSLAPVWGLLFLYVLGQATLSAPFLGERPELWWSAAESLAHEPVRHLMTVEPFATLRAAILTLAYGALFAVTLLLLDDAGRVRTFMLVLVASGVTQAVYGIVDALAWSSGDTVASGTFVSRNHFAGYLEMTLAAGIGYLSGAGRVSGEDLGLKAVWRGLLNFFLSEKASIRIGVLIMALGLILSRSRMGNSAFLGTLTGLSFLCSLLSTGAFRRRLTVLWITILILDTGFLGSYFGIEKVAERLENTTAHEMDNRLDARDMLEPYVLDFLPWGSGLGTFRKVFSAYYDQSMGLMGVWLAAEDDYLQFIGELGVPGVLLLAPLVMTSLWMGLSAVRVRDTMFLKGVGFAASMGIVSILVHSFVDFNLQIPSNAASFVLLLALCWVARWLPEHAEDSRAGESRSASGVHRSQAETQS